MSLHYLLDGYNILHQIPEYVDQAIEAQRQGLIDRIARTKPHGANDVTIVFDGRPGRVIPRSTQDVRAVFTDDETADDRIKETVRCSKNPKLFVVVTNDREIQYAVRSEGATVIAVGDFLKKCRTASSKSDGPQKKVSQSDQQAITDELKDLWLRKDQT